MNTPYVVFQAGRSNPVNYAGNELPVDLTESQLIAALREGRPDTFETLFRTHYSALSRYAYTFLADRDEAEEVVQTVFVTVWERRKDILIDQSVKAYLYRMVRNSSLNRIKHLKVVRSYAADVVQAGEPAGESVSQQVEAAELDKRIQDSIRTLPEHCRMVFQLIRYEGLSYKEAAAQLGISPKTVENQMGKALKQLREMLHEFLPVFLTMCSSLYTII